MNNDLDYVEGRRDLVMTDSFEVFKHDLKAVVFDLDGTLCDSVGQIIACAKHTFAEAGLPEPEDKAVMGTIGLELCEGLTSLLPNERKNEGAEITALYRKIFLENSEYRKDHIFEGVKPLFDKIREKGLIIGYASGRHMEGIRRTLDATFLGDYCDGICAGSEVPSKPDPMMMNVLCERLGVEPYQVLGIGDSGLDIGMFNNAHSHSLGVQTGVWSGDALLTLKPDMLLPKVSELASYLDRL